MPLLCSLPTAGDGSRPEMCTLNEADAVNEMESRDAFFALFRHSVPDEMQNRETRVMLQRK